MIIPNVPRRHAAVKIHRKKRSRTIAMNFQSSIICEIIKKTFVKVFLKENPMKNGFNDVHDIS